MASDTDRGVNYITPFTERVIGNKLHKMEIKSGDESPSIRPTICLQTLSRLRMWHNKSCLQACFAMGIVCFRETLFALIQQVGGLTGGLLRSNCHLLSVFGC